MNLGVGEGGRDTARKQPSPGGVWVHMASTRGGIEPGSKGQGGGIRGPLVKGKEGVNSCSQSAYPPAWGAECSLRVRESAW